MANFETKASDQLKTTPTGIPYIIANEAAERFSYYGMRGILVVFMTKYLVDSSGVIDPMSNEDAKAYFHMFSSAVYAFPLLGALIADWLFGKYKTILWLSEVYCFQKNWSGSPFYRLLGCQYIRSKIVCGEIL